MIKVFLSLPMSGRDPDWICNEIKHMKQAFTAFVVLNKWSGMDKDISHYEFVHNLDETLDEEAQSKRFSSVYYLGHAIAKMADCDYILFHPDNESARGCRCERFVANHYEMPQFTIRYDEADALDGIILYHPSEGVISKYKSDTVTILGGEE